ncbi:MAG TPA: GIY-YIG nuclease family protein [Ktedonobacterales bacterium]
MTAGIYVIRNLVNGHEYVGKTTDFEARWKDHRSQLHRRAHPNPHLTHAWHCYGPKAFVFEVLETVTDLAVLGEREQYWGELLEPVYNIQPFNSSRISTIAPYRYSDHMATRVKLAFDELSAANVLLTPEAIRQQARCSRTVVKMVLHDAEWWTPQLQRLVRYRKTLPRVLRAYHRLREIGCILNMSEIARMAGTPRRTAQRILRDEGLWTSEMAQEALSDNARRLWRRQPDEMRRISAQAMRHQADLGFLNLVKGRATIKEHGYPGLREAGAKGRERLRELGFPNVKASVERQRSEGFPALMRGRETQAATGWKTLRTATVARNRATGEAYRTRILEALRSGAADELCAGALSMSALGTRLGMDHHTIAKHVRLLVQDGLVDASVLEHCHTGWHPRMSGQQLRDANSGQFVKKASDGGVV